MLREVFLLVENCTFTTKMSSEETPANKRIKLEVMDLVDICSVGENVSDSTSRTNSDSNGSLLLDFPGPCEFGYYFRKEGLSMNNSWLFSQVLGQVFIKMGNVLHVQFSLDESKAPSSKLCIRTTPVYCSADHMHLPVNRCTLHALEDDPRSEAHQDGSCQCDSYNQVGHVVRSTSSSAIYCFDPSSERHSVLVPIRHHMYDQLFTFTCKSSCSRGMERRPIRLVFSLEDDNGLVLGRCSLNVKICTCPKRDMDRGEKEFRLTNGGLTRRKVDPKPNDEDRFTPIQSRMSILSDLVDPLSGSLDTIEHYALNGKGDDRMSRLGSDVEQALGLIKRLNQLCTSIEQTLDSFDSDI